MTLKRTRHLDIYITIKELIEEHPDYPVNRLCKFGHITRASYYKWKNRVDNENDVLNKRIAEKMEQIHDEHPDMGYRRIRDILEHDYNIKVNDKRVLRICRKKKIRSIIKHRYNCCTKPASDPAYVAENILNREFHADKLNEKWVTDVSEFKFGTGEDERKGKIYLSVILEYWICVTGDRLHMFMAIIMIIHLYFPHLTRPWRTLLEQPRFSIVTEGTNTHQKNSGRKSWMQE